MAVFLRRHFSIFDYYASDHRANVSVAEFSRKPFDRAKVDPNLMDNSSVIIIQRDEMFEAFIAELNRSNRFEQSSIQADYITFARREFPR